MSKDRETLSKLQEQEEPENLFGDLEVEDTQPLEDIVKEKSEIRSVTKRPIHFWAMLAVPEFPINVGDIIYVQKINSPGSVVISPEHELVDTANPKVIHPSLSKVASAYLSKSKTRIDNRRKNAAPTPVNPDGWNLLYLGIGKDRFKIQELFFEYWEKLGMTIEELNNPGKIYDNLASRGLLTPKVIESTPRKHIADLERKTK